ncbi:hypothetical protein ACUSIJ_13915 [Pseudochelatococcus sp. B33]
MHLVLFAIKETANLKSDERAYGIDAASGSSMTSNADITTIGQQAYGVQAAGTGTH